ncbi:MAG TPA: hypothetical protein PKA82_14375 [Pyrinomonadaceae bacterium]|nr:hypothetical protein [Pyrinomonadaceae bacterium]
MKLEKLTPKLKRQYTKDWQNAFPVFGVYRPMWLLKRNGPVVVGICLERTSSNDVYRPRIHFHNLLRKSDIITLSMSFRLFERVGFGGLAITTRNHENIFDTSVEKVKQQSRIPLNKNLTVVELVDAINLFQNTLEGSFEGPTYYWLDIICLLTWCGHLTEVEQLLNKYETLSKSMEPQMFVHFGTRDKFIESLYSIPNIRDTMPQTLEQEISKFRIDKIPDYGLDCS